ncbi:MAG: TIGR01777 family protein [Chlamydiales bacterium]|nr:TIGR01777 family protein [Chlamydiales bacterium]
MERYPLKTQRILLSGSTGFIGSELKRFLVLAGHDVTILVRSLQKGEGKQILWDPSKDNCKLSDFEGFDALIHLAGADITSRRWSAKRQKALFTSRCRDSWFLSQIFKRIEVCPRTIICASACGYYGDRKEEMLTEESLPGEGFLADLCVQWEKSFSHLQDLKVRVVNARFAPVLSLHGGILSTLIPLFKWGLGAQLGSGKQIISWIALEDAIGALYHILSTDSLQGAVNISSPHPVSQADFAKTLAAYLHRPLFLKIPATLLKCVLGKMGEELLLFSTRAIPQKLTQTAYSFHFPTLTSFFHNHKQR